MMSTSLAITFLYESNPTKWCSGSTLKRLESSGFSPLVFLNESSSRSSKTSPIATISTLGHAVRIFSMAWVPRPPQPINPALSFSSAAPRTNSGRIIWKAAAPPTLFARNPLRDTESDCIDDLRTTYSIMRTRPMDSPDYRFEPDLARASTLPSRWYTDPEMLDAERRDVFG